MALLDFLNVGEQITPKPTGRQTMLMDTGSRASMSISPFSVLAKDQTPASSVNLSYNIIASRSKDDLIRRLENTITSPNFGNKTESSNLADIDSRKSLTFNNVPLGEKVSLFSRIPEKFESKIRANSGSIKIVKTATVEQERSSSLSCQLSEINPTTTLQPHHTSQFITFNKALPQSRHLNQANSKPTLQFQKFQFNGRNLSFHQHQPVNLRSLVTNMELLRVPSRILRYNNDHMMKSLGYSFADQYKTKLLSKPIVHTVHPKQAHSTVQHH